MEAATALMTVVGAIKGTPQSLSQNDDDTVDRLNHRYTQSLLIMFSIVVTVNQLVGDNIHCWVEAHFSDDWADYTNQYCWIKNTYYLPFDERIPAEDEPDKRVMIPYYQWVPLFLLGQALMFFMPCVLWRTLNLRSGLNINNVIEEARSFYETDHVGEKELRLSHMTRHLHSARAYRAKGCTTQCCTLLARLICPLCGRHRGNYLITVYLLAKVLYVSVAIGQIFILDGILGYDFHFYGIEIMQKLIRGAPWTQSSRFPRVTMCDFLIRVVGNTQRYSVQCALPVNLFNEKIFIFFWFWFILLGLVNVFSLITWFLRFLCSVDHHRYVKLHLLESRTTNLDEQHQGGALRCFVKSRTSNLDEQHQGGALRCFVKDYLKSDGIFVLRLIGHNVDGTTVTELVSALWLHYRNKDPQTIPMEIIPTTSGL